MKAILKRNSIEYHRLPYNAPARRLYILPTRQGWLLFAVLTVMLIGSVNYNNNPGLVFTFLLGSMAIVSAIHTHKNLVGTTLLSISPQPVFAGDPLSVAVSLHSVGGRVLNLRVGFSGEESLPVNLPDERVQTVFPTIQTVSRGEHRLPPIIVSTEFPLGIFRAWYKFVSEDRFLVYPAPVSCPFSSSVDFIGMEEDGDIPSSGVDDFKELKSYAPGDPLQRISWKAYSRGRGLYTKIFQGYTGASLVLDWQDVYGDDAEARLSCLCDLVLKAHNMNHVYGLKLPGTYIEPGDAKDLQHREKCLTALALYRRPGEGE